MGGQDEGPVFEGVGARLLVDLPRWRRRVGLGLSTSGAAAADRCGDRETSGAGGQERVWNRPGALRRLHPRAGVQAEHVEKFWHILLV